VSREKEKVSRDHFPHATKADGEVPEGSVPAANRGAQVPGIVEPTTAPYYATLTSWRASRIAALRIESGIVLPVVPVRHPFPHVAQHVIKAKPVGLLLRDLVRVTPTVFGVPADGA
jgi:hypothetical protein